MLSTPADAPRSRFTLGAQETPTPNLEYHRAVTEQASGQNGAVEASAMQPVNVSGRSSWWRRIAR
jgi:hypothetical protein